MNRRDEMLLCLENEGDLYRNVTSILQSMHSFERMAWQIRKAVTATGRRITSEGGVTSWDGHNTLSYYELTNAYLLRMEFGVPRRDVCSVAQVNRGQYERYCRTSGKVTVAWVTDLQDNTETVNQVETKTMTKGVIENKTFIDGVPAEDITDDAAFDLIRQLEAEVASLEKIDHKPKKLLTRIADLRGRIADVVEFIDGRE